MVSRLSADAAASAVLTDAYLDTRVWSGQVRAAERWRREGRKDGWICAWNENSRPREPESDAWILYISVDCVNEMSFYNFEITAKGDRRLAILMRIDRWRRYCRAWLRSLGSVNKVRETETIVK